MHWAEHATIRNTISTSFATVRSYTVFVPSFACTWGFIIATNDTDPATLSPDTIKSRIQERNLADKLKAYDPFMHMGMFGLSKDYNSTWHSWKHPRRWANHLCLTKN
jgi:spermidine synthase